MLLGWLHTGRSIYFLEDMHTDIPRHHGSVGATIILLSELFEVCFRMHAQYISSDIIRRTSMQEKEQELLCLLDLAQIT